MEEVYLREISLGKNILLYGKHTFEAVKDVEEGMKT
jgi:hypothetical protein